MTRTKGFATGRLVIARSIGDEAIQTVDGSIEGWIAAFGGDRLICHSRPPSASGMTGNRRRASALLAMTARNRGLGRPFRHSPQIVWL
jgi:hypothetical protein